MRIRRSVVVAALLLSLLVATDSRGSYSSRLPHVPQPAALGQLLSPLSLSEDQLVAVRPSFDRLIQRIAEISSDTEAQLGPILEEAYRRTTAGDWPQDARDDFAAGFPLRMRAVLNAIQAYHDWLEDDVAPVLSRQQKSMMDFVVRRAERVVLWDAAFLARAQSHLDPVWFVLETLRVASLNDPAAMAATLAILREQDQVVTRALRGLFEQYEIQRKDLFMSMNAERVRDFTPEEDARFKTFASRLVARERRFAVLATGVVERAAAFLSDDIRWQMRFDWFFYSNPVCAEPLADTPSRSELVDMVGTISEIDGDLWLVASSIIDQWREVDWAMLEAIALRHRRFGDEWNRGIGKSEGDFKNHFTAMSRMRVDRVREFHIVAEQLAEAADRAGRISGAPKFGDFRKAVQGYIQDCRRRIAVLEEESRIDEVDFRAWPFDVR